MCIYSDQQCFIKGVSSILK